MRLPPSLRVPRHPARASLGLVIAAVACGPLAGAADPPVPVPLPFDSPRAPSPGPPQDRAWVIFDADTVVAEVASTPEARERGLMFRESVPAGTGMLFVFAEPAIRGFWMANTPVDLDVAFMDDSFRIVEVITLKAMDREVRDATVPFVHALEVPAGWLAEHGIGVGSTARVEMRGAGQDPATTLSSTRSRAETSASSL